MPCQITTQITSNGNLQVGLMTLRSHHTQQRVVEWATRNERRVINQLLGTPSVAALDSHQMIANNPFFAETAFVTNTKNVQN